MKIPDIYFEEVYAKSTEFIEGGVSEVFDYKDENGHIRNTFIRRSLEDVNEEYKDYFDITTPYGYGGPVIVELNGNKETLLKNYEEAFNKYCNDNNIITEFIRFHPVIQNALDFKMVYETQYLRNTVATIVEGIEDPFMDQFSRSARKKIRRMLRDDKISYEVIESPENLDTFKKIYYDTMDRNDAKDFYYFDDEYFEFVDEKLKNNLLNVNIYYEDKCIASGLYFYYYPYIHTHLSGTDQEYLDMSPAYLLKYATLEFAKDKKIKLIHYGGGTTNDEKDSLFVFKSRFTNEGFFDFYIGKKVYDKEIYEKLVKITKTEDSSFFPKYRDK